MNLSINGGESQVPPGFRFHPTEEELLHYYLTKKVASQDIHLDVIPEVDLHKIEPWDIQEKCKIGSTPQNDWYFFSHKDKKYPTGTRTNRATAVGFWKATGRDKIIYRGFRRIGLRKTLVFYKGRAPRGENTDWIMHEYRLHDDTKLDSNGSNPIGDSKVGDGWVVCRLYKKKNYHKTLDRNPKISSPASPDSNSPIVHSTTLDRILLQDMGKTCNKDATFMHMPRLDITETNFKSINETPITEAEPSSLINQGEGGASDHHGHDESKTVGVNDWATLDRFVASHLNGQVETIKQLSCLGDPSADFSLYQHDDIQLSQFYGDENDLWGFNSPCAISRYN